jgi:hypothetical protein
VDQATTTTSTIKVDPKTMFGCALYLSCRGDCWEALANPSLSCSESELARIKASILFNVGLVYHTNAGKIATSNNIGSSGAVQQERKQQQQQQQQRVHMVVATMLEKAIVLYKLSLSIQELAAPISPLYVMALCNNIGQCHSSLFQQPEARRWNERLLELMVYRYDSSSHQFQHNCNYDFFFQNTLSLILRDPCCSPAA